MTVDVSWCEHDKLEIYRNHLWKCNNCGGLFLIKYIDTRVIKEVK